ncbi:MAG: ribulose-phosphate 3-epimerase [Bacteroidota bacterium]
MAISDQQLQLPILAPSILAADYRHLEEDIQASLDGGVQWIHCDVMDGHFVPNISYGPMIVEAADTITDAFMDVHLMIENPDQYLERFVDAGAELLTVHQETCPHLHRTVQSIKEFGVMAGVAVNPATSLTSIRPILPYVDLVLVMSVNPGFGGQSFIEGSYDRIRQLAQWRDEFNHDYLIQVDGGVGLKNIEKVAGAGADVLVAGSAVYKAPDITFRVQELQKLAQRGTQSLA